MARDISPDEAFDDAVAKLTERHFQIKHELLTMGDKEITSAVGDALSCVMTETIWNGLIQMAALDALTAGYALQKLVEHQLRAAAEIDAIKEAEQIERDAKLDFQDQRAESAIYARQSHFFH